MNDKDLAHVQIYAVLICLIINVLDGFDLLAIAFTANEIAIEWEMSPENLGILRSRHGKMAVFSTVCIAASGLCICDGNDEN
jgi:hypothetical protein